MNLSDLELLIPTPPAPSITHRWATITATDPLRLRLDGDTTALDLTPIDLVGRLTTGNRVRVAIDGQIYITHLAGGTNPYYNEARYTGDLNLLTAPGLHWMAGSNAIAEHHPPVVGLGGHIEVYANFAGGNLNLLQRFTEWSGQFHQRARNAGAWNAWRRIDNL